MEERTLTFEQKENSIKGVTLLKINRALHMDISHVKMEKKQWIDLHFLQ